MSPKAPLETYGCLLLNKSGLCNGYFDTKSLEIDSELSFRLFTESHRVPTQFAPHRLFVVLFYVRVPVWSEQLVELEL